LQALAARWSAAAIVLAAAAIHLYLYFDFFHRVHVVGALFLANAAAGFVAGAALVFSGRLAPLVLAAGYSVGTLAGFFWSVYHGLFGYVESLRGPWQEAAGGLEIAALFLLLPLLATSFPLTRRNRFGVTGLRVRRAGHER
jgi:hypothetical protein